MMSFLNATTNGGLDNGRSTSERIVRIEKVMLKSRRPRFVGVNSKGGPIGDMVTDHVVRIHTDSGAVGVGWSRINRKQAEQFLGNN